MINLGKSLIWFVDQSLFWSLYDSLDKSSSRPVQCSLDKYLGLSVIPSVDWSLRRALYRSLYESLYLSLSEEL